MQPASRISDYEAHAEEQLPGARQWAQDMVDAQPLASLCAVFATGFILGAGAVVALSSPPPRRNAARHSHFEGLSEKIAEAVSNSLPKQLTDLWSR